jgi:pimeloyl-ACP methyl ester carboxylesterase
VNRDPTSDPSAGHAEVDGGRLYYEVAGSGRPVALIHPGLWDSRTWDDQFEAFTDQYRVVRYDMRGYGRSSRPEPGRPYSHVRDMAAVMDAAGVDRAALVGCSMGGEIAIDFALTLPARTWALVLVSPGLGGFEGTPEDEAWWEARLRPIEAAVEGGDLDQAQDLRLAIWAPLGIADPAGRRLHDIAFENIHEITMDESRAEELEPAAIERLGEISVPTLVLPADNDPPDMRSICGLLASRIPGARLVEIPDVDHVINVRKPAEFNRVVLAFLSEVG